MYTYIPSLEDLPPHLNATHLDNTEHQANILVLLKIIIYPDITNSNTFTSNYLYALCQVFSVCTKHVGNVILFNLDNILIKQPFPLFHR